MGKRVLKVAEEEKAPLTSENCASVRHNSSKDVAASGICTDKGDFIVRSKTIVDFEQNQNLTQVGSPTKWYFNKRLERLAAIHKKEHLFSTNSFDKNNNLIAYTIDPKKPRCNDLGEVGRSKMASATIPSAIETRNSSEGFEDKKISANHKPDLTTFRRRVSKELNYLETAFGFVHYFYSDAPTRNLKTLSKQFKTDEKTLSDWLRHRDFILDRVFKLKDSLEPDY